MTEVRHRRKPRWSGWHSEKAALPLTIVSSVTSLTLSDPSEYRGANMMKMHAMLVAVTAAATVLLAGSANAKDPVRLASCQTECDNNKARCLNAKLANCRQQRSQCETQCNIREKVPCDQQCYEAQNTSLPKRVPDCTPDGTKCTYYGFQIP